MTLHQPDLAALPADLAGFLRGIAAAPPAFGQFPGIGLLPRDLPVPAAQIQEMVSGLAAQFAAAIEDRAAVAGRLESLRAELARQDLAGFIVPLTDEYQSEYVPLRAQRLSRSEEQTSELQSLMRQPYA